MKRKLLTMLFTLIATLCLCFALVACDFGGGSGNSKGDDPSHLHSFTDYTYNNDATCEKDGTETATCACGKTDTRIKPNTALGHDLKHFEKKEATCLESGHEAYDACKRAGCNYSTYREIKPLGHSFENYIYNNDATCTEDGTETAKCSRCEETDIRVKEDTVLGHEMSFHAQTATCTEDGTRAYWSCATCKKNFAEREGDTELSSVEMDALGHEFTAKNRCVRYDECGEIWEFSDGLTYKQEGSAYTVTGIGTASGDIVIPFGHAGKYVTRIENEAFEGTPITSVTIPECIESIGGSAFSQCALLKRVYWDAVHGEMDDENKNSIAGDGASLECVFFDCDRLTDFYIGKNVELFKGSYLSACYALERLHCAEENERFRVVDNCLIDTMDKILVAGLDRVVQEGYTVIGSFAFTPRRLEGDIVIPDGVTSIEEYAFCGSYSLVSVTLPSTPVEIGSTAFSACRSLERVENSMSATKLGPSSFHYCETLKNFTFGDQIEEIRDYSFAGCTSLESIVLPDNITNLRHCVFADCTGVKTLSIGSGIVPYEWGLGGFSAFMNCAASLEQITVSSENPAFFVSGNCLIGYDVTDYDYGAHQCAVDKTKQTLYLGYADSVIPEGVTEIASCAFEGTALTNATIPQSVSVIGARAFARTRISEIIIPECVTSIGQSAFCGCEELTHVTILGKVTELLEGTFADCIRLSSIEIPESVTKLGARFDGQGVFERCASLSEIHLPDGIVEIGRSAFWGTPIEEFVCPEALTMIGEDAFFDCVVLHSITLNRNLEEIGDSAFANCNRLFEIWNYSQLPVEVGKGQWDWGSPYFGGVANCAKYIYYGDEPSKRYEDENGFVFMEDENGSAILVEYKGGETVLVFPEADPNGKPYSIDPQVLYTNYQQIEKVIFPEGLTQLDQTWFNSEWKSLKTIVWNARNCSTAEFQLFNVELDEFIIGENVQVIPEGIVRTCTKMLTWNAINARFADNNGFPTGAGNSIILEVRFGNKVQVIPDGMLSSNLYLSYLEFPESITYIGENSFAYCNNLKTVAFTGGQVEIGQYAFQYCYALNNLTLTGVQKIDSNAFLFCESFSQLILPESLQDIEDNAFMGCLRLVEIWNKSSLPIVVGSDDYGCVAKYALAVYMGDEASRLTKDKNGFVFYEDDEHACLVDYTGNASDLILPATSPLGKQYDLGSGALCGDFASVDTGDGVLSIGKGAFSGDIKKITIGKNVKSIDCDAIASYNLEKFIWNAETAVIQIEGYSSLVRYQPILSEVVFGDSVKTIPQSFIRDCRAVHSIIFPDSVTTIGEMAFMEMYGLFRVTLGKNVSLIERGAFMSCYTLVEIWNHSSLKLTCGEPTEHGSIALFAKVIHLGNEPSSLIEDNGFLFYEDENVNLLITYLGHDEFVISPRLSPSGKQYQVGRRAFYGQSFKELVLSNKITEIAYDAFGNSQLEKIYFIGTGAEWWKLQNVGSFSTNCDVYFFSASAPTEEQWNENPHWWHYAEDNTTILLWTKNA